MDDERPKTETIASSATTLGVSGVGLRLLGGLALLATLVARALSPALPGTRAGIGKLITISEKVGAVLSGWLLVAAISLCTWLLLRALRERGLGVVYRLTMVPAGAAIITLVLASLRRVLDPGAALALGMTAGVLALAAAPITLSTPRTRAAGLVLLLEAAASILHVGARGIALRASEQALASHFELARSIATVGFVLDAGAILTVALLLSSGRWWRGLLVGSLLAAVALLLGWGALQGSQYGAATWQILASRAGAELVRQPYPLVLPILRYAVEIAALLAAAVALFGRRRETAVYVGVSLLLVSRAATDVPLLALVSTIGALLLALVSVRRADTLGPADAN